MKGRFADSGSEVFPGVEPENHRLSVRSVCAVLAG
jgi:hypothetical protein